ncbi:hypothetical protein PR202_gb09125 [Eleusine coracana subsp. coracana]|uniref:F-box associated beta-propeller type 3 domain-containing protein n=1 Tax=Eleusine coracana subsp. coracana TaxID=191504 RepID=A0AAV5EHH8_ELECO|nr:hypothetical protein PR202_gb09125 [Eleusine coracana subsp. coracana]
MVVMPRKYQVDRKKVGIQGVTFYRFEQPGESKNAELILEKKCRNGISMFSMPLHCDGLIMIPCTTGRIFVCNPSTSEFVELPRGSRNVVGDHRAAFGFDPRSGKYKVARHFFRSYIEKPREDGHEVLTLGDGGEAWKWMATMDPPYAINPRPPICLPGFFYWSAFHPSTDHGDTTKHVILRFNLHDEMFTVHPNPPCRDFVSKNDRLCELDGKLCCLHVGCDHLAGRG